MLPKRARVSGSISLGGRSLLDLDERGMRQLRGDRLAFIPQDAMRALNPTLRVGAQVAEPLTLHKAMPWRRALDRAADLLGSVGIGDPRAHMRQYPHEFSGGMQQRAMIAMGLALEPELLIADEPTTALDVTVQAGILRLLDRLRREHELAVVLITHDLGVLSSIADRVSIFYAGLIVESGGRGDVLRGPRHPYTRALLDALPHPEAPKEQDLVAITGAPPTPGRIPPGCAFHPRCAFASDESRAVVPPLRSVGDDRWLACHVDPFAG
jgi:oligopeptide/dipeptide ABC transporter ATP-binding protein